MSDARWERIKDLLADALALPPEARATFLDEACAGDAELRAEVEALLRVGQEVEPSFLESPVRPSPPAAARRRLGEFELLREIGHGAMGVVYEARQKGLERTVAVKVLSIGLTTAPRQIERFHREAIAVAKLDHPGIVRVFTTGETEDAHYFAMEYVPGGNLATELDRQRQHTASTLPALGSQEHMPACARAVAELADALHYAHEHGIVHRDVKPQNILIGEGRAMRLVDFGLAKDESFGSLSRSGEIAGTPHYMSPEQAGARRSAVDHRTDVYSLGVVLYEMLTLQRPFDGHSAEEVMSQILHRDPLPVRRRNPRVPRDLAVICSTAMAKDLRDRYASAAALAADLRRFLRFESIEARPPGLARRMQLFARRHAFALTAGVLLVLGLVLGASWTSRAMERRERAERISLLARLDAEPDWSTLDEESLRAGREALDGLVPARASEAGLVQRVRGRYGPLRDRWLSEGRRLIEEGKHAGQPETVAAVDDEKVLRGYVLLTRALKVFPEDRELFEAVDVRVFHARITLRAEDAGGLALAGTASYRELDQVTGVPGPLTRLGPLPVESHPLPPGLYRFVIEPTGQPFGEFTRLLRRAADPPAIVWRPATLADPDVTMVLVPAAELRNQAEPSWWLCPLIGRPVPIAAFFLDRSEVSNAQYRRFLASTGRTPPRTWALLPSDPRNDERPVVGVSWLDAVAYAEWAGKRLPSHAEWELAARGAGSARFPWDVAPGADPYRGAVEGPPEPARDEAEAFERYLRFTAPVTDAAALGRNGLYHMLGNVFEWTENLGYDRTGDVYLPLSEYRLLLGESWAARARGHDLSWHKLWGTGPSFSNVEHGFRCARSAAP